MRVLITGGAGFLGIHLAQHLVARGDAVGIFDTVVTYDAMGALARSVSIVQGDLSDRQLVARTVGSFRPHAIFHLGALLPPDSETNPLLAIQTNISGTQHVLDAAVDFEVERVIFTSTLSTFGRGVTTPVPDDALQLPVNVYGVTKLAAERLGEVTHQRRGFDFRGVRFPTIIGPQRVVGGLGAYVHRILAAGATGSPFVIPVTPESRSEVLYVDEAVRALLSLHDARKSLLHRRVYNIGGLLPSAAELVAAVTRACGETQLSFAPDVHMSAWITERLTLDDTAARTDWGWKPAFTLDDVVAGYIAEGARTSAERGG